MSQKNEFIRNKIVIRIYTKSPKGFGIKGIETRLMNTKGSEFKKTNNKKKNKTTSFKTANFLNISKTYGTYLNSKQSIHSLRK